ncbi:MAG: ribosomal RNA small subunit methyltransferase A [Candidatus Kerfeldbacteria bacterium]|nr:ribosomal RNA small subunit methyltransferase A [Candidatus Kerfeldbacteria bacterium]
MSLPSNLSAWTKQLVKQYNLRPGRHLGQHFLVDALVLANIIKVAELSPEVPVLEVGSGLGVLTLSLLEKEARVVAVELDVVLAAALQKIAIASRNLTVIKSDILKLSDYDLQQALGLRAGDSYSVVANLPYEISGAFLRRFLSGSLRPRIMVLLLQAEVANRLTARPGQVSLLTLQAWSAAEVKIIKIVKPSAFYPPPRVNSAIVKFKLYSDDKRAELFRGINEDWFWQLAKAGFSARRKYLLNNLERQLSFSKPDLLAVFNKIGLPEKIRAQELTLEQWLDLAWKLNGKAGPEHLNPKS